MLWKLPGFAVHFFVLFVGAFPFHNSKDRIQLIEKVPEGTRHLQGGKILCRFSVYSAPDQPLVVVLPKIRLGKWQEFWDCFFGFFEQLG